MDDSPSIVIKSSACDLARMELRNESHWKEIDNMEPEEVRTWLQAALETPQGRIKILKYLFCKLHDKI